MRSCTNQRRSASQQPIGSVLQESVATSTPPQTGQPSRPRVRSRISDTDVGGADPMLSAMDRIMHWLRSAFEGLLPWIRHWAEAWAMKTRDLWARPQGCGKAMSIVLVVAGFVAMACFAYLLLYLLPILITLALIIALWASIKGKGL
jgi:hypothetical protein